MAQGFKRFAIEGLRKAAAKTREFIGKNHHIITTCIMVFIMSGSVALASEGGGVDPEAKWTEVMELIVPWISRLGGVIMLIGGVMFGMGFRNDDAEGKSRGLSTMISGAIVIAVAYASTTFIW